jgi:hypothetical protein
MLVTLKSKDWKNIAPHAYYFQPLRTACDKVDEELLHMNKLGFLRARYVMKENADLMKKIIHMVDCD